MQGGVIVWTVVAPTANLAPGSLSGTYAGATASATVGVGLGANVLVGGSGNSIALQPLSIAGHDGPQCRGRDRGDDAELCSGLTIGIGRAALYRRCGGLQGRTPQSKSRAQAEASLSDQLQPPTGGLTVQCRSHFLPGSHFQATARVPFGR